MKIILLIKMNTQQQQQQQQQTISIFKMTGEIKTFEYYDGMTILDLSKKYSEGQKKGHYFKYDFFIEGKEEPLYNQTVNIDNTYFILDYVEDSENKMIEVKKDYLFRELNKWINNKDLIKEYEASDLADFTTYPMYQQTQEETEEFYDNVNNENWEAVETDIDYNSLLEYHICNYFDYSVIEASEDFYLYDNDNSELYNIFNDDVIEGEYFEEVFKEESELCKTLLLENLKR